MAELEAVANKTSLDESKDVILKLFDTGVGSVALSKDYKVTPAQMSAFLRANGRVLKRGRKPKQ